MATPTTLGAEIIKEHFNAPLFVGAVYAIAGYIIDLLPWPSVRYAILIGFITYEIYNSRDDFSETLLGAVGIGIVIFLAHYWYGLDFVVSLYIALSLYLSNAVVMVRLAVLDQPMEDRDHDTTSIDARVFSHFPTAVLLFRGKRIYGGMFLNVWDCDVASYIILLLLLESFVFEVGKRMLSEGFLEALYEAFCAVRASFRWLDFGYFEYRARFYYGLRLGWREYVQQCDKQSIGFDALEVFDYRLVPVKEHEIRLLYIPRRVWNPFTGALIEAWLLPVTLEEAKKQKYEALSYTWGEPHPRKPILICNKRHSISQSLYELLQARQSFFHDRILWVDALCIDQENKEEKASQVLKMRDIYINANRVVAWLGDEFDAAIAANTIIKVFNNQELWRARPDQLLNYWDRNSPQWKAFIKTIFHPYFTRGWICQETGLGYDLQFYIGGFYIRPRVMWRAVMTIAPPEINGSICWENNMPGNNDFDGIKSCNTAFFLRDPDPKVRYDSNAVHPLGLILSWTVRLETTNPLDKVYAMLGISNSAVAKSIVPSYNISPTELFHSTAAKLLQSPQDAEYILPHAGLHSSNPNPDLPSWAPDWSTAHKFPEILSVHIMPGMRNIQQFIDPAAGLDTLSLLARLKYKASGTSTPSFHIPSDKRTLQTTAVLIDTIAQTTTTYNHLILDVYCHEQWLNEAANLAKSTGDQTALSRTLIANRTTDPQDTRTAQSLREAYISYRTHFLGAPLETPQYTRYRSLLQPHSSAPVASQEAKSVAAMHYGARVRVTCGGRKVCLTAGKRLGVVPSATQGGDVLALIPGLQTPYVLRPCFGPYGERAERLYVLVGECYVDGVMEGEMWDETAAVPIVML